MRLPDPVCLQILTTLTVVPCLHAYTPSMTTPWTYGASYIFAVQTPACMYTFTYSTRPSEHKPKALHFCVCLEACWIQLSNTDQHCEDFCTFGIPNVLAQGLPIAEHEQSICHFSHQALLLKQSTGPSSRWDA